MTYREDQRLDDIAAAITAIHSHLERGDLTDGLVFDAFRIRLLEIGEAVKALRDHRVLGIKMTTADRQPDMAVRIDESGQDPAAVGDRLGVAR